MTPDEILEQSSQTEMMYLIKDLTIAVKQCENKISQKFLLANLIKAEEILADKMIEAGNLVA